MSNAIHPTEDLPPNEARSRWLWLLLGAVACAQLLAFWMVCSQQVRLAEVRRAEWQVQQMALSDCLEYIPGSTIASCAGSGAPATRATLASDTAPAVPGAAARTGAMPVSFSYR